MFPQADSSKWGITNNPEGLSSWWRASGANPDGTPVGDQPTYVMNGTDPDQFVRLVNRMKRLYLDFGVRRFVLFVPAGSYFGRSELAWYPEFQAQLQQFRGQDLPVNQWNAMPPWKQSAFSDGAGIFRTFQKNHSDASFELYMGSPLMLDSCTLHSHGSAEIYPSQDPDNGAPVPAGGPVLRNVRIGYEPGPGGNPLPIRENRWVSRNEYGAEKAMDPRDQSHLDRMYQILSPWMDINVDMFWLDAAALDNDTGNRPDNWCRRYGLHEIAFNPYFSNRKIRFGGENIPSYGTSETTLDWCALRQVPYMALDSWCRPVNPTTQVRNWRYSNYPPAWGPNGNAIGEAHYLLANDWSDWLIAGEARLQGYVASTLNTIYYPPMSNQALQERLEFHTMRVSQRWYSMGKIFIADFNGDGIKSSDDLSNFQSAYALFNDDVADVPCTFGAVSVNKRPFVVFAMGDVNGDDKINQDDWDLFTAIYSDPSNTATAGQYIYFAAPRGL